ncbi:N-acetylglucosaminyltransferase-like protein [Selaginella moellendorffii]|uniref:N-acetylglucosaminyltransferase-like protein n=1 Tax=Selaginella moellendorffii TaxID=88036 RepID=D8T6P4_SELML|nr:glycosyltransferase family protein 64 C3 [Selaginella moellendorffii]EFJ07705.1 N-acetylglucosaminyltransferase-like protein [Selaginella moellendorffii]|eukprot:XP_002991277.1 glycosyltransferase family protein 64 C3 [Selaginella moellendorffii]
MARKRRKRLGFSILLLGSGVIFTALAAFFFLSATPASKRLDLAGETGVCQRDRYPQSIDLRPDQLTVLMNGFSEARIHILEQHAQAYSASPVVDAVYILWGNASTPDQVLLNANLESLGAPIYLVRQPSSSLNNRFLPRKEISTQAVLVCDDDISVDLSSLKFAFQVWSENQDRIVGLFPRSHSFQLGTKSWIYTKSSIRYSILLTKFMILATENLYLYSCSMPAGVKEYVDDAINCEDIAMNFLVSSRSKKGPLLVEGSPRDWGDPRNSNLGLVSEALSARSDHRKDRGECITAFHRLWDGMELRYSYLKAVSDVRERAMCDQAGTLMECDRVGVEVT